MKCPKCGFPSPKGANFCLKCGTPLKAPETAERKFVTILYSDLKEFTTLSEQKDPEEVREIIKELFSRFDTLLENFNVGYHEYIGDAVIALFGVPVAHPDDAELAVDAALSMQKEIKDFSTKIKVPLEFRTGINSGEVIYGEIPGKTTVTGDAVNTTQRLASIAEPGKILISDTTAGLTSGKIRTRPLPPVKLKGKKEKTLVFEVISHSKKTYPSFLSPMLGRNRELAKLKKIFKCKDNSQITPTFTVIAGNTGIGKSRLLFEFQKSLESRAKTIPLRAGPYNILIYQPLIDLIRILLDIEESDSTGTIKKKVEKTSIIMEKD
ncbi:zinc ribbon domain-containing protein, partial [candidate division WOR-3 bacterium]|nr:zinc ribbon domain-containing protein [candidate division WOR-3 bacterium]